MEGKRDHPLFKMLQIPHPFSPVLSENPYIQSFDPGTKLTNYLQKWITNIKMSFTFLIKFNPFPFCSVYMVKNSDE